MPRSRIISELEMKYRYIFENLSLFALLTLIMPISYVGIFLFLIVFLLFFRFVLKRRLLGGAANLWFCCPISLAIAGQLGNLFYHRIGVFFNEHDISFLISSPIISGKTILFFVFCSSYFLFKILNIIIKPLILLSGEYKKISLHIRCLTITIGTVVLSQISLDVGAFEMGVGKFLINVAIVYSIIMLLYCFTNNEIVSSLTVSLIFVIISIANIYLFKLRGRLVEPYDIYALMTAIKVSDNYNFFPIPGNVLVCVGWWLSICIFVYFSRVKVKHAINLKNSFFIFIFCTISFALIFYYISELKTYHWRKDSAHYNGCILDFVARFKNLYVAEPAGYDEKYISELAETYSKNGSHIFSRKKAPHVIVIMNESFSNLEVLGELRTNKEVTPLISSLRQNAITGYALASICGGNTANSEYEFLTGNTMAWLPPNAVPYSQYVRGASYSMATYLHTKYGYSCIAVHPYYASCWNRPAAYEYLGFEKFISIDDFSQKQYLRKYISDKCLYDEIIKIYESQKANPLFLFCVSMQNHGGYSYSGSDFKQAISLVGYRQKYPEVEQFLSLLNESDKAIEGLISYFSKVKEEIVIVFYGDHQPRLEDAFLQELGCHSEETLKERQKKYKVPFFIWANYKINERNIERTSLNYLSSYVYEVCGIPLPPYNQFLVSMEKDIPEINLEGFYSKKSKIYCTFDKASETEQLWLKAYKCLQYNNIFDRKNCNLKMFPKSQ